MTVRRGIERAKIHQPLGRNVRAACNSSSSTRGRGSRILLLYIPARGREKESFGHFDVLHTAVTAELRA